MRYYDISLNLSPDTVRWVVAPPLEVHERRRMSRGDDANASALDGAPCRAVLRDLAGGQP